MRCKEWHIKKKKSPTENFITYHVVLRAAAEYIKGEGENTAKSMTFEWWVVPSSIVYKHILSLKGWMRRGSEKRKYLIWRCCIVVL